MGTITITTANRIDRMKIDLMEDLAVLYGLGVRKPDEPELEKAQKLAMQVTSPRDLYWLASRAGIGLHTESAMCGDVDMASAIVAAFYSRVRPGTLQWQPHPESASNVVKAKDTVEGRVLAEAARTLAQSLIAAGYAGTFDGPPSVVAEDIRLFLRHA